MITAQDTLYRISSLRTKRYKRAQKVLRELIHTLVHGYHVTRIVLIGSLANRDSFGFHSDIDLCVEGLPDNLYFQALGELLLQSEEFDVDIIPIETITPEMRERIKSGKVLYEKK